MALSTVSVILRPVMRQCKRKTCRFSMSFMNEHPKTDALHVAAARLRGRRPAWQLHQGRRRTGLTQSAVSRQVQALEAQLEVELFKRDGRRIELTTAGALYQHELAAALGRIRSATLQTIAHKAEGGTLHLAVLPTFGSKWLLPRMNDFTPGIRAMWCISTHASCMPT